MYKKIILTTCLLFATQALAKKEALLVGVSDYGGNPRNDLIGIELDIAKMKQLFTDWGFDIKFCPLIVRFRQKSIYNDTQTL